MSDRCDLRQLRVLVFFFLENSNAPRGREGPAPILPPSYLILTLPILPCLLLSSPRHGPWFPRVKGLKVYILDVDS